MPRALQILSLWNVLCPALLALQIGIAAGFGLGVSGGTFLDASVFLFAWSWILATPVTAIAALILYRKVRWRPALYANLVVLTLWGVSVVVLLLMPMGEMPGLGG